MDDQEEKAELLANLNELLRQDALLAEAREKLRGMILAAMELLEGEVDLLEPRVTSMSAS